MDRLAAMETFVHVVESGSFSAAARRLNLGQPAVSKSIAQLEAYLQVRLLLRSTRGLSPTEAGLAFFERAKRTLEEASEAENAARGSASQLRGTLRICAAVTFARLHIIPHLGPFLEQHPELQIDVVMDDHTINLVEAGVDVALRMGSLADSTLIARKIAECPRLLLATPEYFAEHGEPQHPGELTGHQAVIYSRGPSNLWHFSQGDDEQRVSVSGRVRVNAAEGLRESVLAHQGLAMASQWMFAPELAKGAVKAVLTDWQLPRQQLWAVFPGGRLVSAKARAFVDYVEQLLGRL
ncbi:LysR family transcriptional regulator [Pseudomonas protegens]|uniref:LysR family transcriptional regulator n=1 Tax=Pseudomonas protegens TaxID=380021 RepID=UPI002936EE38|nr:LysR family transcriptional regulator [Pseudomonas protegens]WOE81285.1 LysR family transcriptional regulator [Pseudomonas protegens]